MITKRLKLAYLAHLPECEFETYGIAFDREAAAEKISIGAFSTIEGALLRGFLKHLDADIHVYSFSPFVTFRQEILCDAGLRVTIMPARPLTGMCVGWLPRARQIAAQLKNNPPDLVHGMRNIEGYGMMALLSGRPHVVTIQEILQGIPVPPRYKLSFAIARRAEKYVLRNALHLVVLSQHLAKHCRQCGAKGQISVIPNAASEHFFSGPEDAPDRFIFVGRLSPEKGLQDAVEAMLHLQQLGHSAKLTVVGGASGPDGNQHLRDCRNLASRLADPAGVEFTGPLQSLAVAPLMRKAYALLMPSLAKYEGMGLVIAEALAAGVPVITYDSGPMPEFVRHGESGIIVPRRNPEALADAMRQILTNPKLFQMMRANAKKSGQEFTIESICSRYQRLFSLITQTHGNKHA
jgi:glycosyltransferase involved in cell wall biosynthesis